MHNPHNPKIQLAAILVPLIAATFATGAQAATPANDLEVQFVQNDLDSDGFIALAEWKGGSETFDGLDRDGDAVITRTEFFYQAVRHQTREERFRELDADRDGLVSSDEWKWGAQALAVLDRDGDGSLTPREFGCKIQERRDQRDLRDLRDLRTSRTGTRSRSGQNARP